MSSLGQRYLTNRTKRSMIIKKYKANKKSPTLMRCVKTTQVVCIEENTRESKAQIYTKEIFSTCRKGNRHCFLNQFAISNTN